MANLFSSQHISEYNKQEQGQNYPFKLQQKCVLNILSTSYFEVLST